jgi:hypothetical protein
MVQGMSEIYYKQCRFRRVDETLDKRHHVLMEAVAWIDEKGAFVGTTMTLDGFPDIRFEVIEVFDKRMLEEDIREKQKLDRGSLGSINKR